MRYACLLLLVSVVACGGADGSGETSAADSVAVPAELAVKASPAALDDLVAQLDSARGFYWPKTPRQLELTNATLHAEQFRLHGREAVQRLIDCMTDTTTTATYHVDNMNFKYPRGALCYEVLRKLVDIDNSRQLPINAQDIYVGMQQGRLKQELARGKRAWQVIHNAKAYRLRSLPAP